MGITAGTEQGHSHCLIQNCREIWNKMDMNLRYRSLAHDIKNTNHCTMFSACIFRFDRSGHVGSVPKLKRNGPRLFRKTFQPKNWAVLHIHTSCMQNSSEWYVTKESEITRRLHVSKLFVTNFTDVMNTFFWDLKLCLLTADYMSSSL
jgi:hypothetical protein